MPQTQLVTEAFVVRTEQHREKWAAENVFRAGYSYYLPQLMETVRVTKNGVRRREFQVKPLFPTYLFVSAESGQWHELLKAFGVIGIVSGARGYPALMRAEGIARIRAMTGEDGFIQLPKNHDEGFRSGESARITAGSYTGYVGIVQGTSVNDRIQILLDYMGRKVPFIVRESNLELVA